MKSFLVETKSRGRTLCVDRRKAGKTSVGQELTVEQVARLERRRHELEAKSGAPEEGQGSVRSYPGTPRKGKYSHQQVEGVRVS